MRPVNKDLEPLHSDGSLVSFSEYAKSRRYLIDSIGEYCSYCERLIPASLAVEHIQPKKHNGHLELVWFNLLLACTNCNSIKGHTDVVLADYFWPDRDNTYVKFSYDLSGFVKANPVLDAVEVLKANNTIKLLGLDRIQPTSVQQIGNKHPIEDMNIDFKHLLRQINMQVYTVAHLWQKGLFILVF